MHIEVSDQRDSATFQSKNFNARIRFSPCHLKSSRSNFEIKQEWGIGAQEELSQDFVPFHEDSVEHLLMEFVRTGDPSPILQAGLIYNEVPPNGEISRNVSIYDPKSNYCYTVGGIGLIESDESEKGHFELKDPILNTSFHAFQSKRGANPGGTCTITDDGLSYAENDSRIGVMEYQSGPYNIVRKMSEAEKVGKLGINSPRYIAAGSITNLDEGQYGFSIYRSQLTPDYLPNLHLFLDKQASLTPTFKTFLDSKYGQISTLHHQIKESHGQPTATNALLEIRTTGEETELLCQIKDWATNTAIPNKTEKTISDGICEVNIGLTVKKSPHLAAMIYDLQLALTQDLNVLLIPLRSLPNDQLKLQYLVEKSQGFITTVVNAYGLEPENAPGIINFSIKNFIGAVQKGQRIDEFYRILAGLVAHAIFGFSKRYADQIEVF